MSLQTNVLVFLSGLVLGYGIHALQPKRPVNLSESSPRPEPSISEPPDLRRREPVLTHATLSESLADIMDSDKPTLRQIKLTELALRAAKQDLDMAMHAMNAIQDPIAKLAYMRGVFAHIADAETPDIAIASAQSLESTLRLDALGVLVSQWTNSNVQNGSLSGISNGLLLSEDVSHNVKASWLKAFAKHPLHGEMLGAMSALTVAKDPEHALAMGKDLADWQHQRFLKQLTTLWANEDPDAALAWAEANAEQLTPAAMSQVIASQYHHKPEAALQAFATLQDPQQRRRAATSIASIKARNEGTEAALEWANSLSNPLEQDAAHDRIYQETPRGIGALLSDYADGLPIVMETFPDTPAQSAGLLKGDRIIEIDAGNGEFMPADALQSTIDLIRGEPGTALQLRVLRSGANGQVEDHVIQLNRQQLVLPGR